ncbi:MAG: hypothetical protein MUF84_06850 [Anaerolineae bacterium]|nr:hypothetical protein [Anaerolineae bacterium]
METITAYALTPEQLDVVQMPLGGPKAAGSRIYLEGPAGTGKTTAGVARLYHMLAAGIPADQVLVLTPQRTLAQPYVDALRRPDRPSGGEPTIATVGGLARRMVDLFWPLVAQDAGFGDPDARPSFLTLETAQYHIARVVGPLVDREGYFESVTIDRHRLYGQILDNLNKSAVVGFAATEISDRLKGAWMGEQSQARVYDQAQACATAFRAYCLQHNLLDFSLQMAIFAEHLWQEPLCRDYLTSSYTHLIVDNVEEDTPVAHDILIEWLGTAHSALVILDQGAGYRSFLGADPKGARMLGDLCDVHVTFTQSFVISPTMAALGDTLSRALRPSPAGTHAVAPADPVAEDVEPQPFSVVGTDDASVATLDPTEVLHFASHRFHPQMLDWVAAEVHRLIDQAGVTPGEIVVLAPFLTDALRYSLAYRLEQLDIPVRSHRPSRALRDEPATQTLLTFAALIHPSWGIVPSKYDVAYALMVAITGMDLIRAQLLAEIVYRPHAGEPELTSFHAIRPEIQERITFMYGERYEALRTWIGACSCDAAPLDHVLARLFGEVLSQPGFGFHGDSDAGRIVAMVIESVRKFRWVVQDLALDRALGHEYLAMVKEGVIAAQYLQPWQEEPKDAVLLAPAYTFLLANRPVDVQFWLNVGGQGWWERLYQPLTHPYVLSRRWAPGRLWTDAEEFALRQETMARLVLGLIRRCRHSLYLGLSDLSEQGYEQEGVLLRAFQRVLRRA